jgi:membrane-bound ClpP family serine protease
MALPIYLFLLFISGLMYYGMFTVMGRKREARTGFEEMIGKEALVLEDIDPEGKVRVGNELWSARAQRGHRSCRYHQGGIQTGDFKT